MKRALVASDAVKQRDTRVLVVGPSFRFASGLSAYTCQLSHALATLTPVGVLLLRRLVPASLYPGRARVGENFGFPDYADLESFDGIDWFWGPSLLRGLKFLRSQKPDVVVLQWWTLAALHTYFLIALACRRMGVAVVLEFHELQDPGEGKYRWAAWLNKTLLPALVRLASGVVVHNRHDKDLIESIIPLRGLPLAEVPHGPYSHFKDLAERRTANVGDAPAEATRLLFFGLIRPYKGVEDLIEAFNRLLPTEAPQFALSVVGETWEGWTAPADAIAASPYRDRIDFVNRYVSEQEVAEAFAAADAVVLPYRRASSSGPLNIALAMGLPVVIYDVPALVEAIASYEGAVIVPSGDVDALRDAIRGIRLVKGMRFCDQRTWPKVVEPYHQFLKGVAARCG